MKGEPTIEGIDAVAARGYLQLQFPDAPDSLHNGEVSIYLKDGTWLANEDTAEEALREARFVLEAFFNGVGWARDEIAAGRGHLQQHFPELAAEHCD